MAVKITSVVLLLLFSPALSQYETIYAGSNLPEVVYDKTRQEIINNFLSNKPLLNYVPVYNTEYGHWEGQKIQENNIKGNQNTHPEIDFQRLGEVINKLKTSMQALSHKTKHVYEDKLRELNEVKKLNDDLKIALQNTNTLKSSLHQHQKQLIEITKNAQNPNGYPFVNSPGAEQFLKSMEGLESMVRNIHSQYEGKLAV